MNLRQLRVAAADPRRKTVEVPCELFLRLVDDVEGLRQRIDSALSSVKHYRDKSEELGNILLEHDLITLKELWADEDNEEDR